MIERALFEYLVNVLWQLPLLLLGVWLLVRIARPPLLAQHILWFVTLTLAVLMPMRGFTILDDAPFLTMPFTGTSTPPPLPPALIPIDNITNYPIASGLSPAQAAPLAPASNYLSVHIGRVTVSARIVHWTVTLYLIVLAVTLFKLALSFVTTLRIRDRSTSRPLTLLESNLLITCARRIHLPASRLPQIRSLAQPEQSPMVIGIRRPVLLLPENLRHSVDPTFDEQHLIAVLSHELAHVRRRDYLVNLIARIASLPIAWHPAAIAMHGRIRQTREMICDAQAAGIFDASTTYARSLVSLAELIIQSHPHVEAVGLFDRNRKTLEERIMKLTQPQSSASLTHRIVRIAAGTAILVAATLTAATLHLKPSAPAVYAAQAEAVVQQATQPMAGQSVPPADVVSVQTPTPTPAPQAAAAPDPPSTPRHAPVIIIDGENREMTPEERQEFDRQMATVKEQIHAAMSQIDAAKIKQDIDLANLNALNSEEFKKQMADMKEQLKQLNKSEQFAALNSPEMKKQLDDLKLKFDSPEFREKMKLDGKIKLDMPLIVLPDLDHLDLANRNFMHSDDPVFKKRITDAREQLHAQIKQAGTDSAQIQKAVDQFVKEIDAATQDLVRERTHAAPPAPPTPPTPSSMSAAKAPPPPPVIL
jgi:beta-lactamase regulating signal transducer with metallopeptidase domain